MKNLIKPLLIGVGTLSLVLGIIGIFLPLLPTTPLLLLASICYAHSSKRFYNWLLNNRIFGKYIHDYREGRGVSLKHKIVAISLLWITIGATACFFVSLWWVRIILLGIAAGVTYHLVKIKTSKPESPSKEPI